MAESEGFEPPVPFRVRLISSQVHSTGLCQLSVYYQPLTAYLLGHMAWWLFWWLFVFALGTTVGVFPIANIANMAVSLPFCPRYPGRCAYTPAGCSAGCFDSSPDERRNLAIR
jgi:hypothetical protein